MIDLYGKMHAFRKDRKDASPKARCTNNPFVNFKHIDADDDSSDADDDSSDEEAVVPKSPETLPPLAVVVANKVMFEGYDSYSHTVLRRFADGNTEPAASYQREPDGFILARFIDSGVRKTELPNSMEKDRKIVSRAITPPMQGGVANKENLEDDDADDGDDDDKDEPGESANKENREAAGEESGGEAAEHNADLDAIAAQQKNEKLIALEAEFEKLKKEEAKQKRMLTKEKKKFLKDGGTSPAKKKRREGRKEAPQG